MEKINNCRKFENIRLEITATSAEKRKWRKKFISQDLHITFGCIFFIQQRLISCPFYWKAALKILNGKDFNLRILRPRKINDYVRRSFMIFRIAGA